VANADELRFYQRCLTFTQALYEHAARLEAEGQLGSMHPGEPKAMLLAVEALRQTPPELPAGDLDWCAEYTTQAMRNRLGAMNAEEAEMMLQALGGAMAAAFERDGKLCPPSENPVPAELKQVSSAPYTPTVEDWNAPTWRCLRFRWLRPLRFQLALRVTESRFEFSARGAPAEDGKTETYQLKGMVREGKIELGAVTGRYLTSGAAEPSASSSGTPQAP
jgi:hypothetical protein